MRVLNLTNSEASEIKYEVSKFPDGQQQVKLLSLPKLYDGENDCIHPIKIKARLNNFQDLELICCAVSSLREEKVLDVHLSVPYFLGSRSDRKFEAGSNNYLKTIICPIINSLRLNSITVLDPHSDVLEACLNNYYKEDNHKLVLFACKDIYSTKSCLNDSGIIISPDAGATKKIYKLAESIGYTGDVITCSKDRDVNGKLTKLVIPVSTIVHKDYIIIDDICDGGATFIQIAKTLKERLHSSNRIFLIVTHGIFSKGFEELDKYFDGIYCTDSYADFTNGSHKLTFISQQFKQLNVF